MRTPTRIMTALISAACFASVASAADEKKAEEGLDLGVISKIPEGVPSAVTSLLVFGIVMFVLAKVAWPKIQGGLADREEKIRSEIASAEAAREQAKAALDEYERSLAKARAESQRMLDETRAKQSELAAELKAKADAELTEMRSKALRDIESAKRSALDEIYAESVTLATGIAGKILSREVTVQDQDRMLQESLAELKASQN